MANEIQDPFSWCHDRIFSLLEAHEPFIGMFKPKNIIRWDAGRNDPQKDGVTTSDFPWVTLRDTNFRGIQQTSSTHQWDQTYDLMITTNNWHARRINYLKYTAWQALMYWKSRANLVPYDNPGTAFVRPNIITHVVVSSGQQGQASSVSVGEKPQIPEGWSALFQVDVRLNFETRDLLPPITG